MRTYEDTLLNLGPELGTLPRDTLSPRAPRGLLRAPYALKGHLGALREPMERGRPCRGYPIKAQDAIAGPDRILIDPRKYSKHLSTSIMRQDL